MTHGILERPFAHPLEHDELIDFVREPGASYGAKQSFPEMVLENLRTAGVQQAHRDARIAFTSLVPWPGEMVCAEGRYAEGSGDDGAAGPERRAAVFVGPEFGTAEGTGNLFVVFGEPDIDLIEDGDGRIRVKVDGVDGYHPRTGKTRSNGPDGIACRFIDTDYDEESFFVRHAYFLGANDPYKALKTTLKAEIDREPWQSLHSDVSPPFDRPWFGRVAVKVINHVRDEELKEFRVG